MSAKKRGRPPGPRIRTIKPEMPQDERVGGRLSVSGELLFVRLISYADDEGRFRASAGGILGFAFPHREDVTPARVKRLLRDIEKQGLVRLYEHDGMAYGVVVNFRRHQHITRPTPSALPACPDVSITEANGIPDDDKRDQLTDSSVSNTRADTECSSPLTRVGAPVPDPVPVPSSSTEPLKGKRGSGARAAGKVDQLVPPRDLPVEIADRLDPVLAILADVQDQRGGNVPTPRGVGLALAAFPRRDHLGVVRRLQHWALAGTGQGKLVKDWVTTYRTFLDGEPDADPVRSFASRLGQQQRSSSVTDAVAEMRARAAALRAEEGNDDDVIDGEEVAA